MDFAQKFDGVINIIAGIAFIYYAVFMNLSESNNGLSKRLLALFILISSFCLIRGFNYIFDFGRSIDELSILISSFIPLSIFLLLELLIRRHLPFILKVFISITTLLLVFGVAIFGINQYILMGLMASYVVTLLSFAATLIFNKNLDLLKSEQKLINVVGVISILAIPLIVTDFKKTFGWDTIRLGVVGVLFFLYAVVKLGDVPDLKKSFYKLFFQLIFNLVSAVVISYLFNIFHLYLYVFVIFVMLRMFAEIIINSHESYQRKAQDLAMSIVELFLSGNLKFDEIKKKVTNKEFFLLHKKELPYYNADRLINAFNKSGLYLKNEVKQLTKDPDTLDEILHLFEDFDCNACIFLKIPSVTRLNSENDFFVVLFKWPDLAPVHKLEREIVLIENIASHIKD